jgi:hypothetical protein
MRFNSILSKKIENRVNGETPFSGMPAFFIDLNLDQVIDAITASKQEYNLKPFFYTSLHDIGTIRYRHEIFQDLENKKLFGILQSFAQKMSMNRDHNTRIEKLQYLYQKESWYLDAVEIYCDAVIELVGGLSQMEFSSSGLKLFLAYIRNYSLSDFFTTLISEVKKLKAGLSGIQYCMIIKDSTIRVHKFGSEADYSTEVEEMFKKFKEGAVKDYRVKYPESTDMNHIEAKVLEFVSQLFPDIFLSLDTFCQKYSDYFDKTINEFDREIQFYISYLEFIGIFKNAGLSFCYPQMSDKSKEIFDFDGFDLALANKLKNELPSIVLNDFYLKDKERIIVVSGPNQGGKTTFARMFGQLHYLASLGCPIPGKDAKLFLFDRLFTHFEKEENIKDLRGKLEDDLLRIYEILNLATPNSIIIINEILISTTINDAVFLSKKIMEQLIQMDLLSVWVSFIEELASIDEKTVSMVSTIVPENPALRTFKIIRMDANGLSYAKAIAEKYHLTYESLKNRLGS